VAEITERISSLIDRIPLPINREKNEIYIALLAKEVSLRSIQDLTANRKLTNDLLDSILLNTGEKEDKLYSESYQFYTRHNRLTRFFQGEFQAVINAAKYCRWKIKDETHKSLWLSLLKQYFTLDDTPIEKRKKAIYEYLFLKIGHDLKGLPTSSPIVGELEWLNYYVQHDQYRSTIKDIEEDITLLQLAKSQDTIYDLKIADELDQWQLTLEKYLQKEASTESNTDRLCDIFELQGHLTKQNNLFDRHASFSKAFQYYRKIVTLLPKAQYYSLARLYAQLEQMIDMLIEHNLNDGLVEMIDNFMNEIQPYAEKTGLQHKRAHGFIKRGILYLKSPDLENKLKALEAFHRAKALWRLEFTKEGYILSLIQISYLYNSLGMNFASKYYALIAFWTIWHFTDSLLYKHLPQTFALISLNDFTSGAWLSTMEDFSHYLFAKREFDEKGFQVENDKLYEKIILNIATIVDAINTLIPEITELTKTKVEKWQDVWVEHILPMVKHLSEIKSPERTKEFLSKVLADHPLNDAGPLRIIKFKALKIDWHIEFKNDEIITAIGEEFTAFLQIFLCELARINSSILVPEKKIIILVETGPFQKEDMGGGRWKIHIPSFDSKEEDKIQMHYAYIGTLVQNILQPISFLSKPEFKNFYFTKMLQEENVGNKVLEAASYQRVFRNTIGRNSTELKERPLINFGPLNLEIKYHDRLSDETSQ
jgi:hypothetical protein